MRTFILAVLLTSCAAAQPVPPNRVTLSGGWSHQIRPQWSGETAPGLGLSYGYRIRNWIEPETGVFAALQPSPDIRGARYYVNSDDRFVWITWGVRFVAPVYLRRIEFSGGGGGLYQKYSVSNHDSYPSPQPYNAWGGYFVGSTSVALDRGRRFWLAATPRLFLANPEGHRDRWFQLSGEFSVRFGRH